MTPFDFDSAMAEVAIEDAVGAPCLLCSGDPAFVGKWTATPEVSHRLGAPPGRRLIAAYSLCRRCGSLPDAGARGNERATAIMDAYLAAMDAGWELSGNPVYYAPERPILDWVQAALTELDADRPGFTFLWREEPYRAVCVRTPAGDLRTWVEDGREPPPPPDLIAKPLLFAAPEPRRRPQAPSDRKRRRRK